MSLIDIFITTKGRSDLLLSTIRSLNENTASGSYRLTIVLDGSLEENVQSLQAIRDASSHFENGIPCEHLLLHTQNIGLGPSINQALSHIDVLKRWENAPDDALTVYVQDDVLFSPDWLKKLTDAYYRFYAPLRLGFASGITSPEHPMKKDLGNGMITKDWLRGTNLLAFHKYWMEMWPIPPIDPETGRLRGKPNDGLGSGVDWHFMRVHPKSVCKTGKTNLVIPGLLQHSGYDKSTWLARELPESEADKEKIRNALRNI